MKSALRLLFFFLLAARLGAAEPVLTLHSADKTVVFTQEEFASLTHLEIAALEPHSQHEHRYSGVAVRELLIRAGAPLGEKLRGYALQLVVMVRSRDGYSVAFALADFDEAFSNRTVLLADTEDGKPLADNATPFRLIVPGDKKAARWARMVTVIDVLTVGISPPAKS